MGTLTRSSQATAYHFKQIYDNGAASFCGTTMHSFNVMGVGVSLHFRILLNLAIFFFVATVIALPAFYFCFTGGRITAANLDSMRFSTLSLGNIAPQAAEYNGTVATPGIPLGGLSARFVAVVFTVYDFCVALAFMVFFVYLRWEIERTTKAVDKLLVTSGDYAVYVIGLPPDATEQEVRACVCV